MAISSACPGESGVASGVSGQHFRSIRTYTRSLRIPLRPRLVSCERGLNFGILLLSRAGIEAHLLELTRPAMAAPSPPGKSLFIGVPRFRGRGWSLVVLLHVMSAPPLLRCACFPVHDIAISVVIISDLLVSLFAQTSVQLNGYMIYQFII